MPKITREVSTGNQFSRSSNQGQLADSAVRGFRIVLNDPTETFDIQAECGVFIGDKHPVNDNLFCVSFDGRLEGDSRMVYAVSFQYQSTADAASSSGGGSGADPKSQPPDVRPPNWTTSTSIAEVPANIWAVRRNKEVWDGFSAAVNPVGDFYDGITRFQPIVSINITLYMVDDPTTENFLAGCINKDTVRLGTLVMKPHTVLFRGVQCQPTVESWGGRLFRGWNATYEFAYKRNEAFVRFPNFDTDSLVELGWDVAVPVSGFNCRAFNPNTAAADEDVYGQPLRHEDGKIAPPLLLPDNVNAGDRVRAMIKVFEYERGGASQAPSASPIALKQNGRPLKTHSEAGELINPPLIFAYQVQRETTFRELGGGRRLFQ